jgi:hypothetical protein
MINSTENEQKQNHSPKTDILVEKVNSQEISGSEQKSLFSSKRVKKGS